MVAFSDTFNRADGAIAGTNGWVSLAGTWAISSNKLASTSITTNAALIQTGTPPASNDQWAEIRTGTMVSTFGPIVRNNGTTSNFYMLRRSSTTTVSLYKNVGGATTLMTTVNYAVQTGDVMRIEAEGNAIRGYVNGVLVSSTTDSALPTGAYTGIRVTGNTSGATWDDFASGDIGSTLVTHEDTATAKAVGTGVSAGTRTRMGYAGALIEAFSVSSTSRTSARTASLVASTSRVTQTSRTVARTATAIASASRLTSKIRAIATTASAIVSASRTTSSARSTQRVASAVASATRITSTNRISSRLATLVATASSASSQQAQGATTGLAVARALATAVTTTSRTSSRLATAKAVATRVSSGRRTTSRLALARAFASSTKSTTRTSADNGVVQASASASTVSERIIAGLASLIAWATGTSERGSDPTDQELSVAGPYGFLFQVGSVSGPSFEVGAPVGAAFDPIPAHTDGVLTVLEPTGNTFTVAQEVNA